MAVSLETMNALNFLRETPLDNWLDFYVDSKKLAALLELRKNDDSITIARLLIQFVEQAEAVEKDVRLLADKDFDDEDINYCEVKAARLWLLALRCCAALKWDLGVISKHGNVMTLRALFDRLLKWAFPEWEGEETLSNLLGLCSQVDASSMSDGGRFAAWLYARWVVVVDIAARFPDPLPRATVSNPQGQVDPNLAQAEALKAATANIRTLAEPSVGVLRRFTTDASFSQFGLKIPLKDCFQSVSEDEPVQSLLVSSKQTIPTPRFDRSIADVSSSALLAKTHFDLMCYEFASGDIPRAKQSLEQVLAYRNNAGSNEYASIDAAVLDGYCQAFGLKAPNNADPFVAPITDQTSAILAADNERRVLSSIGRQLIEKTASTFLPSSSVHADIAAENVVASFLELLAVSNRCLQFLTGNEANLTRFARVISRQLTNASSSARNKTIMSVIVRYLCANLPGVDSAMGPRATFDQPERSTIGIVPFVNRAVVRTPAPQPGAVAGLLSDGNDLWQLLLSYDSTEIKNLMLRISPFVLPARFNVPIVLGEEVLTRVAAGAHQEYITVLMSKLEQLAKLGKIAAWQANVNACVRELGPLGNDPKVQTTFAFEALRIELEVWHNRLHRTTDMRKFGQTTSELALKVKGMLQMAMPVRMKLNSELMLLLVTFLINTSDWEYIIKKIDGEKLQSPNVDLARLFAAFAMTIDQGEPTTRRVAQSIWKVLLPTMEDSVQMKRAGNAARPVHREQNRNQLLSRRQLVAFTRNIKEQTSVSLLLSLLGKLFNCANGGMNRMFIQHSEYWPTVYDGSNVNNEFLTEMIVLTIDNGLLINPNNAFYLRSKGDFLLASEHYGQAMEVYLEALLACSDGLSRPFPDNVIDDSMWINVMKCCNKMDCRTQEALVCQLMRDPTDSYQAAAKALEASVVYDASTAYFPLIFDSRLVEYAADAYAKMGLTHKVELVLRAMSTQDMNIHNVPAICAREVNKRKVRLLKIMCSQYFRLFD